MYMVRGFHPGEQEYTALQHQVYEVFRLHYGAHPNPSPQYFLCLTERDGKVPGHACLGLCCGDRGKLFSEYYLENEVDALYGVKRDEIVEIGQVASYGAPGSGKTLFFYVLCTIASHFYRYVLLTATAKMREIIKALDFTFDDLGPADRNRVLDKTIAWGNYYDHDPRVVIVDTRSARVLQPCTKHPMPPPHAPAFSQSGHLAAFVLDF